MEPSLDRVEFLLERIASALERIADRHATAPYDEKVARDNWEAFGDEIATTSWDRVREIADEYEARVREKKMGPRR